MEICPRRSWLYRNGMLAVILALAGTSSLVAQATIPQYGRKPQADKGPRALGLVQLSPTGKKSRIIPIAIMMDGKFYDAGSYKAAPVPMALDFGVVYEGFRTGVSQGVFTITQPGQLNHVWIAEGTWLAAGAIDPSKPKKYSPPKIVEDDSGPPVLHRRAENVDGSGGKDQDKEKDKRKTTETNKEPKDGAKPAIPPASPSAPAPVADTHSAAPETAKPTPSPEPPKAPASASDETIADPNRPRLRRGKPDASERHEPFTTFDSMDAVPGASSANVAGTRKSDPGMKDSVASPHIILIPAISDTGGSDPRPYTYDLKPAEETSYRGKMIELAAAQLRLRGDGASREAAPRSQKSSSARSSGKAAKAPQPTFDDVTLRIFDLSSSNEPVLVLSAKTHSASLSAGVAENVEEPKEITLIARSNLENELQKLFFTQTDSRHLDVTPRMELIDAVDADGDGRGELLFRRTSGEGSSYAIYRVTRDGLWTLFEGTP